MVTACVRSVHGKLMSDNVDDSGVRSHWLVFLKLMFMNWAFRVCFVLKNEANVAWYNICR